MRQWNLSAKDYYCLKTPIMIFRTYIIRGKFALEEIKSKEVSVEKKEEAKKIERKKLKPLPTLEQLLIKEKGMAEKKSEEPKTKTLLIDLDIDSDAQKQKDSHLEEEEKKSSTDNKVSNLLDEL
jgi:hypothetical protein